MIIIWRGVLKLSLHRHLRDSSTERERYGTLSCTAVCNRQSPQPRQAGALMDRDVCSHLGVENLQLSEEQQMQRLSTDPSLCQLSSRSRPPTQRVEITI
jgi:hypothetical protein